MSDDEPSKPTAAQLTFAELPAPAKALEILGWAALLIGATLAIKAADDYHGRAAIAAAISMGLNGLAWIAGGVSMMVVARIAGYLAVLAGRDRR